MGIKETIAAYLILRNQIKIEELKYSADTHRFESQLNSLEKRGFQPEDSESIANIYDQIVNGKDQLIGSKKGIDPLTEKIISFLRSLHPITFYPYLTPDGRSTVVFELVNGDIILDEHKQKA